MKAITTVRGKGQVTIPSEVRAAARIEEGTVVELTVTEDGVLMRPKVLVDADDAWFFSAAWQSGERTATAELEAGEGIVYESEDAFLSSLDDE